MLPQCGNYGNSLSRIFAKNSVKSTILLKVTKGLLWRNIFSVRENLSFFHTVNVMYPQCGNLRIFLFLRFYVKSKVVISEAQKMAFWFCSISAFEKCKNSKSQKPLKNFMRFWLPKNLISRTYILSGRKIVKFSHCATMQCNHSR